MRKNQLCFSNSVQLSPLDTHGILPYLAKNAAVKKAFPFPFASERENFHESLMRSLPFLSPQTPHSPPLPEVVAAGNTRIRNYFPSLFLFLRPKRNKKHPCNYNTVPTHCTTYNLHFGGEGSLFSMPPRAQRLKLNSSLGQRKGSPPYFRIPKALIKKRRGKIGVGVGGASIGLI